MSERRLFFTELTHGAVSGARQVLKARERVRQEVAEALDALAGESSELDAFDGGFFDSYEMSYSMTLAYPREFFEQMAEQAQIEHQGVETLDLVRALHEKGVI